MKKLVQKVKWELPGSSVQEMYMYGEASVEANQEMQEPLEMLYQYENHPDIRIKIREYIDVIHTEIKRCEKKRNEYNKEDDEVGEFVMHSRLQALTEVKNNLQSILDEVI